MVLRVEHADVEVSDPVRNGIRLRTDRLRVTVSDDDRDGVFVASDDFSTVYGAGESPDAAIRDYISNLFAQFAALDADRDRLGPRLRDELTRLSRYFVRDA